MREQIVVKSVDLHSEKFGHYKIEFIKPTAASVELVSFFVDIKDFLYSLCSFIKAMINVFA